MKLIVEGNTDEHGNRESWLDVDQLLERISYKTSRESMAFSIRALVKKGMIVKGEKQLRRSRIRVTLLPTSAAFDLFTVSEPFRVEELEDVILLS